MKGLEINKEDLIELTKKEYKKYRKEHNSKTTAASKTIRKVNRHLRNHKENQKVVYQQLLEFLTGEEEKILYKLLDQHVRKL